jgi:hypothetical protein
MKKPLRTIGLFMLIGFDVAFIAICFMGGFPWNYLAIGITALIVSFEIYGVAIGWKQKDGTRLKKTISQMYWRWGADKPTWATVGVITFGLSMLGLCLHLIAFDQNKD